MSTKSIESFHFGTLPWYMWLNQTLTKWKPSATSFKNPLVMQGHRHGSSHIEVLDDFPIMSSILTRKKVNLYFVTRRNSQLFVE